MKICNVCCKELPKESFYKKRSSLEGCCKSCKDNKRKRRIELDPSIKVRHAQVNATRRQCRKEDPEIAARDSAYAAEYYQKHKESYDKMNSDWYKANPEKRLAVQRNWQQKNQGRVRYLSNKRRIAKLNATPSWAKSEWETFLVEEIYNLALDYQKALGTEFHVDHIVPLQSDKVCGLHCAANLQILSAHDNYTKSNKHWPDMW